MLIALLLVALVCLALGLIFASAYWLVGSLAASAVAALLLWRVRGQAPAAPRKSEAAPAWRPQRHRRRHPRPPATAPAGSASADPAPVWVIDGQPDYHRQECERLGSGEPEQIPRDQAKEDGFHACSAVRSGSAPATTPAAELPPLRLPLRPRLRRPIPRRAGDPQRRVWVVDGRPDYHAQSCARLDGTEAEQIPWAQANEDGFTPCPQCAPDDVPAEAAPEPVAELPAAAEPVAELPAAPEPMAALPAAPVELTKADVPRRRGARGERGGGRARTASGRCGSSTAAPSTTGRTASSCTGADAVDIPWSQATEDGFVAVRGLRTGRVATAPTRHR